MSTDAEGESQVPESGHPTIIVDHELERMCDEAALSLEGRAALFQRAGNLVRVINGSGSKLRGLIRSPGEPNIQSIPLSQMHLMLASSADWKKWKKDEGEFQLVPSLPPDKVVKGVLERGEYPQCIRELQAVIETPMLRLDHQVIQEPGYDEYSGLLYLQPKCLEGHSVPEFPNREDIDEARELLLDMIFDFQFRNESHRSAYLAGLLTCHARFAIDGNIPLFMVTANSPRTGKTLLTEITSELVVGRDFTKMSQHVDEEAERKVITSLAMSGCLYVLIDNISKPFGSAALDMALTTGTVSDRAMHTFSMVSAPWKAVTWATANNPQFKQGSDTAMRTLEIALETELDRPEIRQGFRHHPLKDYVKQNRARLVMAALTMLRGYCAAGMPDQGLKNWGGFDEWSRLIRHCLVWCGLPDPYEAHAELLESADTDRQLKEDLILGLKEVLDHYKVDSITFSDVLSELESQIEYRRPNQNHTISFPRIHQALMQLCNVRDGRLPPSNVVGNRIKRFKGSVSGKYQLVQFERDKHGSRWGVREVSR